MHQPATPTRSVPPPTTAPAAPVATGWERALPRFRSYPTHQQLVADVRAVAAEHPGRAVLRSLGSSREGRDIPVLTVGTGARDVFVLAGPHPNEPVGFLTAVQLVRLAATDPGLAEELDVTWHVVPCMDPDAMVLGQGWYGRPLTVETYHRHFYRPRFAEQVEWTFPHEGCAGGPLPETLLLAALVDELRPALVCSLHNADFSGAFTLLTQPRPDLAPALERSLGDRGLPLQAAPADGAGEPCGRATFQALAPSPAGTSSVHHAARHGALGVVTEVPLWNAPETGDAGSCGQQHGPLLEAAAGLLERDAALLAELHDDVARLEPEGSPLLRAAEETSRSAGFAPGAYRRLAASPEGAREASVAERHQLLTTRDQLFLRAAGMLLRVAEGARRRGVPGGEGPARRLDGELRTRSARLEALVGLPVEPRVLVAAQLAVGFAAARSLRG
ncbi:M14 family zinc carboxypeptidase [Kineococcus sp. NUM-3379]